MICRKKKKNRRENEIIAIFKQDFNKKYENMEYKICLNIKWYNEEEKMITIRNENIIANKVTN